MSGLHYHFRVGAFECRVISDGTAFFSAGAFFVNAPKDDLGQALAAHSIADERIPTPLNCLLVRTEHRSVLIETGMGSEAQHGTGQLLRNLQADGVEPEAVDMVILSHAHTDHSGGVVNEAGLPAFPRARYVLSQVEWDFWHSQRSAGASAMCQKLEAIRSQLDLIPVESALLPGLQTLPAPGHTPGQIAVHIASSDQQLLHVGDTVAHIIHLEHPTWNIRGDDDKQQAVETRRKLLGKASAQQIPIFVYHFPFPGLGRLTQAGECWRVEFLGA